MAEIPVSRCDRCGQSDDHPKHVVRVGGGNGFFHQDDTDHDGFVRYHFDCAHEWQDHADPRTVACAQDGAHGDELRAIITGGK